MQIFQVYKPFVTPEGIQGDPDRNLTVLFYLLENSYAEANLSLNLFEKTSAELSHYMRMRHGERPNIPRVFLMRTPFLHAHSFLFALDTFQSTLQVLKGLTNQAEYILTAIAAFEASFPGLRDIRNSAHHMEDRVRGLKTGDRHIDVQPANTGSFVSAGGAVILDNLSGNRYGNLLANGHFGEVEISAGKMTELQSLFQNMINTWPAQSNPFPIGFSNAFPVIS